MQRSSCVTLYSRSIHINVSCLPLDTSLSFALLSQYTERFVEEINDMLNARGLVSMNELIRQYDLPIEYVNSTVTHRIVGASSSGVKCESGILYTKNYVHLQQNILLGCLEAAFHPLRVTDIMKHTRVNENLIQSK